MWTDLLVLMLTTSYLNLDTLNSYTPYTHWSIQIIKIILFNHANSIVHLVTLLGTPVQSNAIQYNSSAINSTFTKFLMFSFCWLCLKCVNSIIYFCIEVTVKGAVVLDYIILRGGVFCPPYLPTWGGQNIRNTSEYNAVQYSTTTNYDLSDKTYYWINTFMTV